MHNTTILLEKSFYTVYTVSFSTMLQSALRLHAVKLVPSPERRVSNKRAMPFISGNIPKIEETLSAISILRRPKAQEIQNTTS